MKYKCILLYNGGILHKVLTSGGYIETSDSTQALLTTPAYRFFLTDHLGSVRVVADASGNVLQRNDYLPYGEDYDATYAPGGDILAGLNIPLIIEEEDDDEEEENLEGGNRFGEIEEGDEEDPGDEVVGVIGPEYYRSYNAYRFSGKEQVRGLYDFGARWFTPKIAHWTTMDPLAEKYYSISPYVYCAGNPVNLVDPEGMNWYSYSDSAGTTQYKYVEGRMSVKEMKEGGYTDLGFTYLDESTNTYYSLFGKKLNYTVDAQQSVLGHLYERIDQLVIAHCKYIVENETYCNYGGEDLTEPSIDYAIDGIKTGEYRFIYKGIRFSSEERGTIYRAIEQKGVVFRNMRIEGDRLVKTTLFPTYETTRAGIGQNYLIDSGWKGYFIVAQPRSGKSFDSIQILFNEQNAKGFLSSCNNLFGTKF